MNFNDVIDWFSHEFLGGKTTCISLLEHFYEADEGQILIDGIPVQNYDYKFYHKKVHLFFVNKSISFDELIFIFKYRFQLSVKNQFCMLVQLKRTFYTV